MTSSILGWIGSFCFSFCGLPQARKAYRDGHCFGLSSAFVLAWMAGEVCYVAAVLLEFGWVGWMMFNYILNTVCLLVILRYKFWPRRCWQTYTMKYAEINEDVLIEKIRQATNHTVFQPPGQENPNAVLSVDPEWLAELVPADYSAPHPYATPSPLGNVPGVGEDDRGELPVHAVPGGLPRCVGCGRKVRPEEGIRQEPQAEEREAP